VPSTHLGPETRLFLLSDSCGVFFLYGAPSLTRGRICRLQLLLAFVSVVGLGSEPHGSHNHILLSQIRDFPNLEGHVTVFISPRNRVAQLYSEALGSLQRTLCSTRYTRIAPARIARKTPFFVAMQLLLGYGMTYFFVAYAAIFTDCVENTVPLLFLRTVACNGRLF
jgi:hypothetical protein